MIVQYYEGGRDASIFKRCMDTVPKDEYVCFNNIKHVGLSDYGQRNAANRADICRYHYLANNPDSVFLDADVEFVKEFVPFKTDKPYFAPCYAGATYADNWAIHGNGQKRFFLKLWTMIDLWNRKDNFGTFIFQYLKTIPEEYYLIPFGYYKHLSLKTWRRV